LGHFWAELGIMVGVTKLLKKRLKTKYEVAKERAFLPYRSIAINHPGMLSPRQSQVM
jgi:hypothetical protein